MGIWLYFKFFKLLKIKNILFIDGSLGTGKSFLSVAIAIRMYKKQLRKYYVKLWLLKILARFKLDRFSAKLDALEKPLLYSNIRLRNIPFVKLTKDLMFRQNFRFAYGSVLLLDEFSLMADQFTYKDREMSERLSLFFKLFRHETRNGYAIINSQSTSDLHYSLKYVLSDYLYIHHKKKYPFVISLKVQEMVYSADKDGGNVINARSEDIEETCKTMLVLKKYFKYYDPYCYSIFTDMLPVYKIAQYNDKDDSLKDCELITFKEYRFLMENIETLKAEEKKHEDR